MQTFIDSKPIVKEKLLEKVMQQQNMLTFGSQDTLDMNHKRKSDNHRKPTTVRLSLSDYKLRYESCSRKLIFCSDCH